MSRATPPQNPADDRDRATQVEVRNYIWGRISRGKQKLGDAIIAMATLKSPDARIITAILDRVDPKPAYSNQTLPVPIKMDVSTPQAVEATRQRILTAMGNQKLPVDMGRAVLDAVNQAGDRNVARELADMLAMAQQLKEERMSRAGQPEPVTDSDVIGVDAAGNEIRRPVWGRPRLVSNGDAPAPEPEPSPPKD